MEGLGYGVEVVGNSISCNRLTLHKMLLTRSATDSAKYGKYGWLYLNNLYVGTRVQSFAGWLSNCKMQMSRL